MTEDENNDSKMSAPKNLSKKDDKNPKRLVMNALADILEYTLIGFSVQVVASRIDLR